MTPERIHHLWCATQMQATSREAHRECFAEAIASEARREALDEAYAACDGLDHAWECAAAIRALADAPDAATDDAAIAAKGSNQ